MEFSKLFCVIGMSLSVVTAFADADQVCLAVNTTGPDRYADGAIVRDGEAYAVAWVKTGCAFGGFTFDGQAVNTNDNIVYGPFALATKGHCDDFSFNIPREFVPQLSQGSLHVVLLDTRKADGTVGTVSHDGIAGYSEVSAGATISLAAAGGPGTSLVSTNGEAIVHPSNVRGAPTPKISSIKVEGDYVYLTVENTTPLIRYNVSAGSDSTASANAAAGSAAAGNATSTITLRVPASQGYFFKVVRDPLTK